MKRLLLFLLGGLSLLAGAPALAAVGAPVVVGVPADTGAVPAGAGAVPTGAGAVPTGAGAVPAGAGAVPAGAGAVPAGTGAVPADPRITAAVRAWKTSPLYVDRLFARSLGTQEADLRRQITAMPVPVYVAVMPHGEWFAEKGDTVLLAGWLATANAKPGVYVVVDRTGATGAAHLVRAYAPTRAYQAKDYNPPAQLDAYLKAIEVRDSLGADAARTQPLPDRPGRVYEPEEFTVGKALANGFGGFMIGAIGGSLAAGVLVAVAAVFGRRREGHG